VNTSDATGLDTAVAVRFALDLAERGSDYDASDSDVEGKEGALDAALLETTPTLSGSSEVPSSPPGLHGRSASSFTTASRPRSRSRGRSAGHLASIYSEASDVDVASPTAYLTRNPVWMGVVSPNVASALASADPMQHGLGSSGHVIRLTGRYSGRGSQLLAPYPVSNRVARGTKALHRLTATLQRVPSQRWLVNLAVEIGFGWRDTRVFRHKQRIHTIRGGDIHRWRQHLQPRQQQESLRESQHQGEASRPTPRSNPDPAAGVGLPGAGVGASTSGSMYTPAPSSGGTTSAFGFGHNGDEEAKGSATGLATYDESKGEEAGTDSHGGVTPLRSAPAQPQVDSGIAVTALERHATSPNVEGFSEEGAPLSNECVSLCCFYVFIALLQVPGRVGVTRFLYLLASLSLCLCACLCVHLSVSLLTLALFYLKQTRTGTVGSSHEFHGCAGCSNLQAPGTRRSSILQLCGS